MAWWLPGGHCAAGRLRMLPYHGVADREMGVSIANLSSQSIFRAGSGFFAIASRSEVKASLSPTVANARVLLGNLIELASLAGFFEQKIFYYVP